MPEFRILLLEDNSEFAASVGGALEARGYREVFWVSTVAEARALYEVDRFDVLLCDYELPDGTGLDFLAGIRAVDKAVAILWSGLDRSSEIAASGLDGIHAFRKDDPIEVVDLIDRLATDRASERSS